MFLCLRRSTFSLRYVVDADVTLEDFRFYSIRRLMPPAESSSKTAKSGPCHLAEGDSSKKPVDSIPVLDHSMLEHWQRQFLSKDKIVDPFCV